ncbi:MAG: 50S ribosomal protein L3 [Pseudomonadota bacterium]
MRTGLFARKIGMTRIFDAKGQHVPVSVVALDHCRVVAHRNVEKDGYQALQLGIGKQKPQRLNRAVRGHFAKASVEPCRRIGEFRVDAEAMIEIGSEMQADHFVEGQKIDVTGISRGKGFAGAMKRHNFSGLRASHGVSVSHRSHGSTGQCQDPGKVFKGKKMAGHMGAKQVTVQNLEIVSVDIDMGVVLIKGAIPGGNNDVVILRDAVKHARSEKAPYPGSFVHKKANDEVQEGSKSPPAPKDDKVASETNRQSESEQ